jgi:very-short-patch-repair endonuclease
MLVTQQNGRPVPAPWATLGCAVQVGRERERQVDNWQAFVPMARRAGGRPEPAAGRPAEPLDGEPAGPEDGTPAGAAGEPGEPAGEAPAEGADETLAEAAAEAPAEAGEAPAEAGEAPAEDLPSEADERARTLSLIGFLADYEARKNPPVHDIKRYDHFLLRDTELPGVPGVSLSPDGEAWLTVDFPDLPPRPEVPRGLVPLLGDSAAISPRVRPEVGTGGGDAEPEAGGAEPEAGGAEPGAGGAEPEADGGAAPGAGPGRELISAAEDWIAGVWEPFAARWAEAAAARTLHRDLFQQRELLARDGESAELAWGFGRLRWRAGGVLVDHPLITIPVEMRQDEATQRIRVCPAGAPQVEARCLAGLPLADRAGFTSIGRSVSDEGIDPWDGPALRDVLRRLVRAVDQEGTLAGQDGALAGQDGALARDPAAGAAAVADGTWALFLRRRPPDCLGFLDRMRALYGDGSVAVPGTLRAVISAAPPPPLAGQAPAGNGEPGPLLLPLPANEEQQRILVQAQHSTGVTVQGPPGTGKSHTIANIIGYYAAQGKRVLVVAEKEQALRDLNAKIPEGIKDLTVTLPGTGGHRDLQAVIGQIQARVTGLDTASADERIRQLTDDLDTVDRRIAAATQALLATREAEVERLPGRWGPVETPTRAEAARWVAENAAALGYIDDRLTPATARPISGGELAEFVTLIAQVGVNRADACAAELPRLAAIPPARDLGRHLAKLAELRASVRSISGAVQDWGRVTEAGQDRLRGLAGRCRDEMDWMAKTAGSWLSHVREQASDPLLARDWLSFGAQLSRDREDALELRALLTAHNVVVPAVPEPGFMEGLHQARERLAQGGRLGMFSAPAKRALQDCRVDGREPSTAQDIDLCLQAIQLGSVRRQMLTSWRNQLGRIGGPDLDAAVPEDVLGPFLEDLSDTLAWPRDWAHLREDLAAAGISSPAVADADTLGYLAEVCVRAGDQIQVEELSYTVDRLGNWLRSGARSAAGPGSRPVTSPRPVTGSRALTGSGARGAAAPGPVSPLWNLFADALARRDMRQWQHLREELAELHELAPSARRLREIRRRLSASAPVWTARILAGPSAAGDPAEFDAAWQWRQLDSWVRAAHGGPAPAQLQARLEELAGERGRVVAGLVSERAWRQLASGPGDRQVPGEGKGAGEAGGTVPVWIMPAARALSSFRPVEQPPFDVLVVDEASQIGLDGLPLLALARQAIVIGDDKQASPENAGLSRHQVFGLLDEHLGMIPEYRTLFDPDGSLYDIACQRFPGVVMLTEHFRCLPPIIAFSSTHAYNYRLVPLRDQPPRPGWAALGAVRVPDGYRNGTVNVPEADAVVDLVAGLCADPGYDGMSMGVISLLGSAQSKLIWDRLYDRVGPEVMARRGLRSGEPANFQGDERDVIIISTVVAVDPAGPAARVAAMTSNAAMRRINVAASRARQQMWVVHSADPDGFPEGDLRGALIRHCQEAAAGLPGGGLLEACESAFERDVVQRITARGYRGVYVQHPAGRYRIDIVVAGPHSRLAVECDGDRWQGPDAWHRDRARQQVLERAGWTFERVRASEFYRDPDAALLPLWRRLTELGIPTGEV